MQDSEIIRLYWARREEAIQESQLKYGAYCRTIAERIRKKEPKPKKANTPKKREVCRVEIEPGESRIMQCPRPMLVTAPAWLAEWFR